MDVDTGKAAILTIWTIVALEAAVLWAPAATPPPAAVRYVTNNYFGVEVVDPYRWMEQGQSPEFQTWLRGENAFARATLESIPARKGLLAELRRLDSSLNAFPSALNLVGERLFYMQTPPPANVFQLFMRPGRDAPERLIFDPQKLPSPDGAHNSLDLYHAAPDGEHVICRVSRGGSEETTLYVVATTNAQIVGSPIQHAESGNSSWHPNGRAFFYKRLPLPAETTPSQKPKRRVYMRSLGGNNDLPVLGLGVSSNVPVTEAQSVSVQTSWGSDYILGIVSGSGNGREIYVAPISSVGNGDIPWRNICRSADQVSDCLLHMDTVILVSRREAPGGKLLRVPCQNPDLSRAEVVMAERSGFIRHVAAVKDATYVVLRDGVVPHLVRIPHEKPRSPQDIALPVVGSIDRIIRDPRQPGIVLPLSSSTEPTAYYALDSKSLKFSKLAGITEPSGLVPLEVQRVNVRSKDGTLVPLTIVFGKGLAMDGRRPALLTGYGAYGISQSAGFDLSRNPWFAAGGVYAVAHVRGGGELGDAWRRGGKGEKKQNGIDDFIACADYLVAQGYTTKAKLAAKGTSAGGVVVGSALNQRPDLFRAVIIEVGCLDALRFEVCRNGPANVHEWGSVKTQEGFHTLRAMSPYEHVVPGTKYPAVLLTAGINDPRVDVWQPAKMAARLRAASTSGRPILLAVNYDEGHFHTTLSSFNEHHADTWSFLLWQLDEIR